MTVMTLKSREETRFLALLARTQERASKLGASRKTFLIKNRSKNKLKSSSATTSQDESSSQVSSSNEQLNERSSPPPDAGVLFDWRLPKARLAFGFYSFVETLGKWLIGLERHPQGPRKETLNEYKLKVEFLRKVIDTLEAEKHERAAFSSRKNSLSLTNDRARLAGVSSAGKSHGVDPSNRNVAAVSAIIPHGPATTGEPIAKEIYQRLDSRHDIKVREQLFNGDALYGSEDGPTHRPIDNCDLDSLLKAHQQAQEQIAEEMLHLTRSLKERTLAAGEIVRKDTKVMELSSRLADKNSDELKVETDRLSERESPCRCWTWFILSIVCFTFILMIWIMKFFPKRRWHEEL